MWVQWWPCYSWLLCLWWQINGAEVVDIILIRINFIIIIIIAITIIIIIDIIIITIIDDIFVYNFLIIIVIY